VPINVLVADDSEMMRKAMRKTLDEEPRIRIVGEATSFASTMQMIADLKPDVLLLDCIWPISAALRPVSSNPNLFPWTVPSLFHSPTMRKPRV
jgi:chemotaxis response regulator CheB